MIDPTAPFRVANIDLLKKLTRIKPKTNYKEGVRKFIEWYLRYHKND